MFTKFTTTAALIAAAALSCSAAQAQQLFAFDSASAPQYAPTVQDERPKTPSSIRACSARSSPTRPTRRPAPSSSIPRTPFSISCSATARRSATASASAAKASPGRASSRSRARPSGRIGIRRSRDDRAPALSAALDRRRPGQSARRARHVSRRQRISHPRHQQSGDHRQAGVERLHPPHQRRRHRSLQPRAGRRQGRGAADDAARQCRAGACGDLVLRAGPAEQRAAHLGARSANHILPLFSV